MAIPESIYRFCVECCKKGRQVPPSRFRYRKSSRAASYIGYLLTFYYFSLQIEIDEYWSNNPEMQDIPIFYASSLAAKCMTVFHTYINMMGTYAKQKFKEGINPFESRYIRTLENIDSFDDNGALVLMASPGFLQNGVSREYFEKWCCDSRNGVCITGYCVEGTLAQVASD